MSRGLDPTMAAALAKGVIQPAILAQITLASGNQYVWSGVGDLVWNGNTYAGLGQFASMGAITEASAVQAEGTTVTLAGIAPSQISIPALGVTPPSPPRATVAGENIAWSIATVLPVAESFSAPPNIWNAMLGCSGVASGTASTGSLAMTNGQSLGIDSVSLAWSGYKRPLQIPAGARITGVYPVVVVSSLSAGGAMSIVASNASGSENLAVAVGTQSAADLGTWNGTTLSAMIVNSVPGSASLQMTLSFVGLAVYYMGSPLSVTSLMYEALNDVSIGGPAKIWFGLMSNGAFLGTPYLIFSGAVDKPSIKTSPNGSTITLALENRLVNLQRPNNRKYTAADQRLYHPTDLGFNWVEILQEISLKEGQ